MDRCVFQEDKTMRKLGFTSIHHRICSRSRQNSSESILTESRVGQTTKEGSSFLCCAFFLFLCVYVVSHYFLIFFFLGY